MVTSAKAAVTVSLIGAAMLLATGPAEAGRGSAVGAGLLGFGVGAMVGSALTPRDVYVVPPPPPPPAYYGPASYGLAMDAGLVRLLRPLSELQSAHGLLRRRRRARVFLPLGQSAARTGESGDHSLTAA